MMREPTPREDGPSEAERCLDLAQAADLLSMTPAEFEEFLAGTEKRHAANVARWLANTVVVAALTAIHEVSIVGFEPMQDKPGS